jgi:SNF2 family DNA or RNA helicase
MKLVHYNKMPKGSRPWDVPGVKQSAEGTLFSQKYLTVTIDEAHHMRNLGAKHQAALRILQQACVRLILTGTPLLTGPKVGYCKSTSIIPTQF